MNEAIQEIALEEESESQGKRSYVARAYAAGSPTSGLTRAPIPRHEPGPEDVQIGILYCGVCHSDLHQVRNEWSFVTAEPSLPTRPTISWPGTHG
jgi:alcohol dehydrogenase (NADP+)